MRRWVVPPLLAFALVSLAAETPITSGVADHERIGLTVPGPTAPAVRLTGDGGAVAPDTDHQRITLSDEVINVKAAPFGARGDGVTDDTRAIQRAIGAAAERHASVVIPPGSYVLTSPLRIFGKRNFRVVGLGGAVGELGAVVLKWNGPSNVAVMTLDRVRDSEFAYFSLVPGKSTFEVGLEIGQFANPGPWISTHNRFKSVQIAGGTTAGIRLSRNASPNNELHVFDDVTLNGKGRYGIYIGGMQSKWNRLTGGSISHKETGIYVHAGSFLSWGTNFSHNARDIHLRQPVDAILIEGAQSEGASQFLTTNTYTSAWAVTVKGSRLSPGRLPPDGVYVGYFAGGPLVLIGNDFADGVTRPTWRLAASNHDGTAGTTLVALGNVFPNRTPFRVGEINAVTSLGNVWVDQNNARPLPAHVGSNHPLSQATIGLSGVTGLSGTHVAPRNLRGSLVISGDGTTGSARFPAAEPDRGYFLTVTPVDRAGTPRPGSNRILAISKSTTGFDVAVEVAPGAGSSVTFDWHLIR